MRDIREINERLRRSETAPIDRIRVVGNAVNWLDSRYQAAREQVEAPAETAAVDIETFAPAAQPATPAETATEPPRSSADGELDVETALMQTYLAYEQDNDQQGGLDD